MKMMKKPIGFALAAALVAFPLGSVIAQASIPTTPVAIASTATKPVTPVRAAEVVTPVVAPEVITPVTATEVVTPVVVPKVVVPTPAPEVVTPVVTPEVITTVADADGKLVIPSTQYSDFIDKLQLALAVDPAREGELNKRHALRKLAQAQQFMKDGNVKACKVAFNEYKDKIAKAQEFLTAAEDPNSEVAISLAKALADVDAKNIQALTTLITADKLPPQAAQRLALNVVRTMDKAVVKIQKKEAKVDPVVPTDTEKKDLEKQAKAALIDFKTAVNEKDKTKDKVKVDQKVKDNHSTTEKIQSEVNQKLKKLSQPTLRTSDNNKDGRNQQEHRDTNNRGDNHRGDNNHGDHK